MVPDLESERFDISLLAFKTEDRRLVLWQGKFGKGKQTDPAFAPPEGNVPKP